MKTRQELSAAEVEALHQTLMRRLGDTSVPTLPQVAMKIVELVGDPNSAIKDYVEAIQTDQALTGRLLRMANSAAFGQRSAVTKLDRAVMLLGLDRLKAMALGFHLSKAAADDSGEFSFKRLWTQSLLRGWFELHCAERVNNRVSGEAFIIGLLSDVGVPMMPQFIGSSYAAAVSPVSTPAKLYQSEVHAFPFTHQDIGAVLARVWKLPDTLATPIGNHHTAPNVVKPDDPMLVLRGVAYLGGMISFDPAAPLESSKPVAPVAKRLFGFEPDDVRELMKAAAADFDNTKSLFKHLIDDAMSLDAILDQANSHLEGGQEKAAADAPASAERVTAGDVVLELERSESGLVTVYILDASGSRLLSEQINPAEADADSLRAALMLDDAPDDVVGVVQSKITALAA